MPFGLWTWVGLRKHKFNVSSWNCTLVPPGIYDWTVRLLRQCYLMSNYFDYLLFLSSGHITTLGRSYKRSSVVCQSVCHDHEPCKSDWTNRDTVWDVESGVARNHILHGGADAPTGKGTFGVSGWLKNIVKQRILQGLGKRVSLAKTGRPTLTIHMSYDVFPWKDVPLGLLINLPISGSKFLPKKPI